MVSVKCVVVWDSHSDEEMEEATPIEANDSDYDPNKEAKKEVRHHLTHR